MTTSTELLLDAVLALPENERLELAEAVLSSLAAEEAALTLEWRQTLRRRAEEVASGNVQAIPWVEVQRRARERLNANA